MTVTMTTCVESNVIALISDDVNGIIIERVVIA